MKSQVATRFGALFLLPIATLLSSPVFGQRPFTAKDDVGLALFEYAGRGAPGGVIKYSPDGQYFAVVTERGRLDLNAPEDTIWVFRIEDVQRFMQHPEQGNPPAPLPLAQIATDKDGPLIEDVRWLPDSSGIAFTALKKSACCKFHQLFVTDVRTHAVKTLTPEDQDVGGFDIRTDTRYVYEVSAPELLSAPKDEQQPAVALTGKTLWTAVFPNVEHHLTPFDAAGLWAVIDGNRRQVLDSKSYEAPRGGRASLSLSPDGRSVVAILKAENPPKDTWGRYKAPPGYDKLKFPLDTSAYHLIDLTSGSKKLLVNAPSGLNQNWHSHLSTASWSADGQSLLLPDIFFPLDVSDPKEIADRESHPYIAVLRLKSGELSKVLAVKAGLDKERYAVKDARFEDDRTVVVNFDRSYFLPDGPPAAIFRQEADNSWRQAAGTEDPRLARLPVKVEKREGVNQPPLLVTEDKANHVSRTIWDPNPQLQEIALGTAEVIHGKDSSGYEWEAGLVKPPGYTPGKRYPLVIQTHGFSKGQFLSSGIFTSAFAARAMAAQGMVVVQIGWNANNMGTPQEGPGEILLYESVVKKLAEEGLVDPAKVGTIGFSRSVYHVLAAIATAEHPLAAASVTEGVTFGYFEYLFAVDSGLDREADAINGGKPFDADGLKNWLARSPDFNMDKVRTPLLLLQPGAPAVFGDWEPYAALRYLKKPVDLIMLQAGTHVMTNPTQRLASETINVDWFRFWLKGEEDPDPAKAEQYKRWRELGKPQLENETKAKAANVPAPVRSGYKVIKKYPVPGEGSWDYITIDSAARRVYVSHGSQIQVLDADTGKIVGQITATQGVHGVALALEFHRGFTSNGDDKSVTIFDTDSLAPIKKVQLQRGTDFILYDPFSKRVFPMNEKITVIDAQTGNVAGTVDLGGIPEAAVSDGRGTIYVALADKNMIGVVDPIVLSVTKTYPIQYCTSPHSLSYDAANHRLFVGCRGWLAALDATSGKFVGGSLICSGVDSSAFDPETHLIFESCGEGVVSIIRQTTPDYYELIETVPTQLWAKTMAFDPLTMNIYLPTAEFETLPKTDPHNLPQRRIKPESFTVLVLGKQ